jgi:hypothetical protein
MTRLVRAIALAVGLALLLSGCGGGPTVTEVEGTITGPDGKPMPDVLVQFNPDANTKSKVLASSAVSDTNGRYALTCDNGKPGAVLGPHKIVLIDNALGNEEEPDAKKGQSPVKRKNRVPQVYLSPVSTPLQTVVEPGKKVYDLKIDRR